MLLAPITDVIAGTVKELTEQRSARMAECSQLEQRSKDSALSADDAGKFDELLSEIEQIDGKLEERSRDASFGTRFEAMKAKANASAYKSPEQRSRDSQEPDAGQVEHPDIGQYSILRAINLRADQKPLDGLEGEISQEIAHRTGKSPQGFYVPWTLGQGQRSGSPGYETRDVTTTTGTGAVGTVTSGSLIDILTNEMRVMQAGATSLTNMRGNFQIPKQTQRGTAYWVTEGTAVTESNQTIGQVAFAPSTVGAFTDYTRKFALQTSVAAENFVRRDLATVLALELDRVGLNGSGSGAEPEGVQQNSSVPTVPIATDGGAPTWSTFVDLETEVTQDNAGGNSMAYITNAKVIGKAKQVEKASGTAQFIHDGMGVNGYPMLRSNQVVSNLTKGSGTALSACLFGNWADLIYAFWGGLDVLVDPYSLSTAGGIRVVFLQDVDVQLRHTEAFSKCVDIDTK